MVLLSLTATCFPQLITTEEAWANVVHRYKRARGLIAAQSYQEAHDILIDIDNNYGADAQVTIGASYGNFLYYLGICQVNLQNYDGAAHTFEKCYVNFPNDELTKPMDRNNCRVLALIQWAGIEQLQGRLENAIKLYERALQDAASTLDRTKIDKWTILINLGQCLIKTGQEEKGIKYLFAVMEGDPKALNDSPRKAREQALMILARHWVEKDADQEINDMLDRFDHLLEGSVVRRYERNDTLRYFAQRATSRGSLLLALRWYDYLAHADEALAQLEVRAVLAPLAQKRPAITRVKKLRKKLSEGEPEEVLTLMGIGSIHFELQNFIASYAAYDHLGRHFKQTKHRPQILYNAVVSAVKLGKWREVQEHGMTFLDEFPEHELRDAVLELMVEVLFLNGDYAKALEIALDVRKDFDVGDKARDLLDFIVGVCLYHLERYEEARPELDSYVEHYPNGIRREPGRYYQAMCYVKLLLWSDAAGLLDGFITDYPESTLMAGALFHRALCHFMLDEYDESLAVLERLEREYPEYIEMARAFNLRGDILQIKGKDADAAEQYLRGKLLADQNPGQEEVAAYSLYQLIAIAAYARQWPLAGGYYDEFKTKHEGSAFEIDATISAIPAMAELDRSLEMVRKLETFIAREGGDPNSDDLAKAFNAYRSLYKREFGFAKLIEKLKAFPYEGKKPASLTSWLLLGRIEAMEQFLKEEDQPQIDALYAELQSNYKKEDLANYVIVKHARWLNAQGQQDEAMRLYLYVIEERHTGGYVDYALLDLAMVEAQSPDPEVRARALQRFILVADGYQTTELAEAATLGIARLLMQDRKWPEAQERWRQYLDHRNWTGARAEANYQLASCLDRQGRTDEALKSYVNVYVNYEGHIKWSSRAYLRVALIQREREDRQRAYLVLDDMLKRMGHLEDDDGVINKARTLYNEWKAELAVVPEQPEDLQNP